MRSCEHQWGASHGIWHIGVPVAMHWHFLCQFVHTKDGSNVKHSEALNRVMDYCSIVTEPTFTVEFVLESKTPERQWTFAGAKSESLSFNINVKASRCMDSPMNNGIVQEWPFCC